MIQPPPKPPPLPENKPGSWLSILMAVVLFFAAYGALTFLTLGFFGPVLIVVGVLFAIVGFHYFVWGWWLGQVVRDAAQEEQEAIPNDPAD